MISPKIVRVKDIILDKSHPLYKNEDYIGLIYYKDLAKQTLAVTKDIKHLPYKVVKHSNGDCWV